MALFTIKSYADYKFFSLLIRILFIFFFLLTTYVLIELVYTLVASKNYATFCYGLFAANALISNCLFAFGRSTIFIERFNNEEQKLIYFAATRFLFAAFLGFFISGWAYLALDKDFSKNFFLADTIIFKEIVKWSVSIYLTVLFFFTLSGVYYFIKWSKISIRKMKDKDILDK